MFARHRQALILHAAETGGSVRTSDLTRQLDVSEMTIRRDLEVLAREGLVEKVHGGAILPGQPGSHEAGSQGKLIFEQSGKTSMARAAASLVEPGAVIALTGGTTTFRLAQCLLDVPGLTIVTNSLRVAGLFSGSRDPEGLSVIVTGGVRTPTGALVGPAADLTITSLYFDTVFVGCHGIGPEAGLTTPSLPEAETNRKFVKVARRVVVMADHTKWGTVSLAPFMSLNEVDVLVTDAELPPEAWAVASEKVNAILV